MATSPQDENNLKVSPNRRAVGLHAVGRDGAHAHGHQLRLHRGAGLRERQLHRDVAPRRRMDGMGTGEKDGEKQRAKELGLAVSPFWFLSDGLALVK